MQPHILLTGGSGFIGSSIAKHALSTGFRVTSLSSSGLPYRTPNKGHQPAWTKDVEWIQHDILRNPRIPEDRFRGVTAVVHTLGTLLPASSSSAYKAAVKSNSSLSLLQALYSAHSPNPLSTEKGNGYEEMNTTSALNVCQSYLQAGKETEKTFVYISAEDIYPSFIVPRGYIESKRKAEEGLTELVQGNGRAVFIRPGLVYHAHFRPMTVPAAVALDFIPGLPRAVHVDQVAAAVIRSVQNEGVQGVVGVDQILAHIQG